ncbi:phage tail protein [Janthinobacterium sp. RB2R34]|uniref:phage tail protein n=1 Tax=Janthinobacterium sp. RB2R34 TaxID=3424193 RepID=UPI003F204510
MNRHRHEEHDMVPFAVLGAGQLPVGAVTAFAGALGTPIPATAAPPTSVPPAGVPVTNAIEAWGWMLCDGRALDCGLYPQLFAVLGYTYGGSGGSFKLPDYRGNFLRGTDCGAGTDPDAALRTSAAGGNAADDGVGSRQTAAMLKHEHNYSTVPSAVTPSQDGSTASGAPAKGITSAPTNASGTLLNNDTGVSANETRPANIAVNFLIKFTYGAQRGAMHGAWA